MPAPSTHISLSSRKGFTKHRCELVAVGRGYETDAKRYSYDNCHRQRFSLLQYTLAGAGRFRAGATGTEVAVSAPAAFLVNCPSPTAYWLVTGGTWEFVRWIFVGDMAVWHVEQIVARHGPVVTIPPGSMPAKLMQQTYQEAATRCALDKHLITGRLYQVLMELSRLEPATPTVTPSLSRATSFIEHEYANPTLAGTCGGAWIGVDQALASCGEWCGVLMP